MKNIKKIGLLITLLMSNAVQAELTRSGGQKNIKTTKMELVQKTMDFVTNPELPNGEGLDNSTVGETKERIKKGLTLIKQLLNNDIPKEDTHGYLNNIAAISWGLFALAVQKNQGFLGGTIVIEDPNLLFFNYFLNYTKMVNPDIATVIEENESQSQKGVFGSSNCFSYARKSSHFKEAQKIGKGYEQFGIDMRYYTPSPVKPKTEHFLPINKTQFLFGKISYNISFIKFEHYGLCNQNTGNKDTDLINHTKSFLFPGKKANPRRGENVPSDDAFNDLKKQTEAFAKETGLNKSLSSCKNIHFVRDIYNCATNPGTRILTKELRENIIYDFTSRGWEEKTLSIRRGNEVILTTDELKTAS